MAKPKASATSTRTFLAGSLRPNIFILCIGGLWMPGNPRWHTIATIHCIFNFIVFTCPTPTLGIVYNIVTKASFAEILDNCYILAQISASVLKTAIAILKRRQIRECVLSLNTRRFCRDESNRHLIWVVRTSKMLTWIFAISCGVACVTILHNSVDFKKRRMPMNIWLPYDIKEVDRFVANASILLICMGMLTHPILNATIDSIMSNFLRHATAQTRILKDNILTLHKMDDGRDDFNDERIYAKICECVDHFEDISDLVQTTERIFGFIPFFQLIFSALVVCAAVYKITIMSASHFEIFMLGMFLLTILMELYVFCWYGDEILDETNTLNDAIYFSRWYEFGPKSKKALIIFRERVKRPLTLEAGGMFSLNLVTFTMVLRYSYSLLAVFKSQGVK